MQSDRGEVTRALRAVRSGDSDAWNRLVPLVYRELRELAASYLRRERPNHTLQSTALVHEAYLRLVGQKELRFESRAQFLAICANIMREILVEYARGRGRVKRGGLFKRVPMERVALLFEERALDIIALDETLKRLESVDRRKSQVVVLRFFGGLTAAEIASRLGISNATVERDWTFARAWLRREIKKDDRNE